MIRLAVRVRGDDAGVVLAELLELSPAGVEERDVGEGEVEYVIYGAPGELPALPEVEAAAGDVLVRVSSEEVPDDWAERWKVWHRPVDVAWNFRRLRVRPPWEEPAEDPEVIDLVIDPGQAFGTGGHHTTRLCLELLLGLEPRGPLADWGCGTGVLAIAAERLGFRPVTAVDNDRAAIHATIDYARVNGVSPTVGHANLREQPGPYAPVVCANLVRPLLLDVCRLMDRPPETMILSGLLREEADEVAAAFAAAHGLAERERRSSGEWSALLLQR